MVRWPENDCPQAEPMNPACCITNDSSLHNSSNRASQAKTKCTDFSEHNSYRFSKPRIFCPNDYVSKDQNTAEILAEIATNVGPRTRPAQYSHFLENTLQMTMKQKKQKAAILSNMENDSCSLKAVELSISAKKLSALIDTGSTHTLIAFDIFQTLKGTVFRPIVLDMKVAGSVLTNNIVGEAKLNTVFPSTTGDITIPLTFLIAHQLNGYQAILDAQMLSNPRVIKATTPYHMHLNESYNNAVIPLRAIKKSAKS